MAWTCSIFIIVVFIYVLDKRNNNMVYPCVHIFLVAVCIKMCCMVDIIYKCFNRWFYACNTYFFEIVCFFCYSWLLASSFLMKGMIRCHRIISDVFLSYVILSQREILHKLCVGLVVWKIKLGNDLTSYILMRHMPICIFLKRE